MKSFRPNIDVRGRRARGVMSVLLLVASVATFRYSRWLAGLLIFSGGFVAFEAARGWCALRACGIKTKI